MQTFGPVLPRDRRVYNIGGVEEVDADPGDRVRALMALARGRLSVGGVDRGALRQVFVIP